MEYKDLYKTVRITSVANSLAKRCQNVIAERNEKRRELFWSRRGCVDVSPESKPDLLAKKKNTRAQMLQKWKEEKQKKLEESRKKQKPIFKVGVVHRKVTGSPIIHQSRTYPKKNVTIKQIQTKIEVKEVEKRQGIITRSRAKKMETVNIPHKSDVTAKNSDPLNNKFCKIDTGKKKLVNSNVFKVPEAVSKLPCNNLTFPYSPKMLKCSKKSVGEGSKCYKIVEKKLEEVKVEVQEKAEEENKEILAPQESVTPEKTDDFMPIHYSPFVTVRSGKKSIKKAKRSLTMDVDEQIKKEEMEMQCRIFSFRKYIECETKRLLEKCDRWKTIYLDFDEVPQDIEGEIDCLIGKTNLLTSDKFMQFKGLIDKCEKGDPMIKVDDLQGFQDWVSIEVERIDEDFNKLEKRKLKNWTAESPVVEVGKPARVKVAKHVTKKPVGKSNIRSHILAARKLLKESNADGDRSCINFEQVLKATTPKKQSLLKAVLTSEKKKKREPTVKMSPASREARNSGLEIMIASQKNKLSFMDQVSPKTTDFEIFVTAEQTPNRSILKKTPRTLNSSKGRVTFNKLTESVTNGGGLHEKYFEPLMDDECSPMRIVLGDLGNHTPAGMNTRSRTKRFSASVNLSPRVL